MGQVIARRGRPLRLLDAAVTDRLLEAVEHGASVEAAAAAAGIHRATLYRWLGRARRADDAIEETGQADPAEEVFRDFRDALTRAHAKGEVHHAKLLHQIAEGGHVLRTRTRRYRDPATGQIVEETTTDIAPPNLRAIIFCLERRYPETWGRNARPDPWLDHDAGPDRQPPASESMLLLAARVRAARERMATSG